MTAPATNTQASPRNLGSWQDRFLSSAAAQANPARAAEILAGCTIPSRGVGGLGEGVAAAEGLAATPNLGAGFDED